MPDLILTSLTKREAERYDWAKWRKSMFEASIVSETPLGFEKCDLPIRFESFSEFISFCADRGVSPLCCPEASLRVKGIDRVFFLGEVASV
ncbi:MAG: hypothetical protein ACXABY_01615 [Candidatus Thorarchaeota archaeon]|jgi:hypothetical protein